jgi:Bacterial Ig domain
VVVTVAAPGNTAPTAHDIFLPTGQDQPLTVMVSAADAEDDVLSFVITIQPANGTLGPLGPVDCDSVGQCTASLVYTPVTGFVGQDTFSYTANDGELTSAPATVTIDVFPPPCQTATFVLGTGDPSTTDGALTVRVDGAGRFGSARNGNPAAVLPTRRSGGELLGVLVRRVHQLWWGAGTVRLGD